jgi:uncharacterized membrane protein
MIRKIGWILIALLCVLISFYPIFYLLNDDSFGILSTKSQHRLANVVWKAAFYLHILPGGLALLVGWTQFSKKWRTSRPRLHRNIGKLYLEAVLVSATAGIFIGKDATGGMLAQSGFVSLGIIWLTTTLSAFLQIRKGNIIAHQKLMIFSYAACFAAVTLRLWLPLLIMLHKGEFEPAYRIVAWLCWVPNLMVAWWIVNRLEQKSLVTS